MPLETQFDPFPTSSVIYRSTVVTAITVYLHGYSHHCPYHLHPSYHLHPEKQATQNKLKVYMSIILQLNIFWLIISVPDNLQIHILLRFHNRYATRFQNILLPRRGNSYNTSTGNLLYQILVTYKTGTVTLVTNVKMSVQCRIHHQVN